MNINLDTEGIELHHIEFLDIDVDRILTEDYEQAHIDFVLLLVSARYKKYVKKITETTNGEITHQMRERSLMYAKLDAQSWLHHHGKQLIDRSIAFLVMEAQSSGWFREDYFAWDTFEEFLANMIDAQSVGTTDAWYWNTFATKVVPAAKKVGISPGRLLSASSQARKLHQVVTGYNQVEQLMKSGTLSENAGEQAVGWIISLGAAPNVTSSQMEEQVKEFFGKSVAEPEPLSGYTVVLPDNRYMVLVVANSETERRMISNSLRNKVALEEVGVATGIEALTTILHLDRITRRNDESLGRE